MHHQVYIKPGISIYSHRDGHAANRIRFLAWRDSLNFLRRLWVHQGIGVCLSKNWSAPCPVCEDAKKQLDKNIGFRTLAKQGVLLGKNPRILAQIIDRNEEAAGVQIWDVMGNEIERAIRTLSVDKETGLLIPWTDPNFGCDLIYDYDSRMDMATPSKLRKSQQSKLDLGLYGGVMDFDADIIYRPSYEELASIYAQR